MTQSDEAFARLSLNQRTTQQWSLREAVEGCVRAGVPYIALWRDKVEELGLSQSTRLIRESGLKVSSLCRGGFFSAADAAGFRANLDENRRAIEEAAELGTDTLVLVCGGLVGKDIDGARRMIADGIAEIVPFATQHGVKLAIEPLHPMFAADRSAVTTLREANDIAERHDPQAVGVIADVYHIWWDPTVYREIDRAGRRLLGFHVSDWIVPLPDVLLGRGMMGDGVIQLGRLRAAVERAGYNGPIEVEIFNQEIWDMPGDEVLDLMKRRYAEHVLAD